MSEKRNDSMHKEEALSLDDGRRVKVLSPGMMVFKRFIRNRLAIAGICVLVFMFSFSFIGGVVSPYRQDEVFYKYDKANKEYASAVVNTEYRYVLAEGAELPATARASFNLAAKNGQSAFTAAGVSYSVIKVDDGFYRIATGSELGSVTAMGKIAQVKANPGVEISKAVQDAAIAAVKGKQTSFECEGATYSLTPGKAKSYTLSGTKDVALASLLAYDSAGAEYDALVNSFDFRLASETAMHTGTDSFELDGETYTLDIESETTATVMKGDKQIASVSNVIVSPVVTGITLPMDYKAAVADAITEQSTA